MSPEQCTKVDFNEIKSCDLFIAFPGKPPSPGIHIEIGWAAYCWICKKIVYNKKMDYMNELDKNFKEVENDIPSIFMLQFSHCGFPASR